VARPVTGSVRGLALGGLLLAGCEVISLDGLSGSIPDAGDAAPVDSSAGDTPSEGPSTDGAPPVDSAHPADSADGAVRDSAVADSPVADAAVRDAASADADAGADSPAEAQADAGSVYATSVLSDAPLAYWRMDDAAGTVARDTTGNGNDGQYVGGVTLGTGGALIGDADTAVTLDGVSGHVDMGNRFAFAGNASYTLELWAQPHAIGTSYQRVISRELPTSPREGYLVFVRAGSAADPSTFSMERWEANQTNQCPETNAVTQVWHHLVATYDGTTSRIYLDGALAASQPAALALNATSASLWIGASVFDTAAYFNGAVDEVAVYGTALSATRIAAHYHASGR
jgi:hypothetical protein